MAHLERLDIEIMFEDEQQKETFREIKIKNHKNWKKYEKQN